MTSEGNTAAEFKSSTNPASYTQTTHPNDLFESPSSENQDFASHSALCKNIAIARDYARSYQDLKHAYAESSTLENARSKLIVSLTDTDLWELESEIAQVGLKLE
ncbi:hypothetical protein V866_008151 [Kwoniella sp. B9012]